jgi:hypothetical protein
MAHYWWGEAPERPENFNEATGHRLTQSLAKPIRLPSRGLSCEHSADPRLPHNRPRPRRRPRPRNAFSDVESKMWTGVGRFVVPKGRNDSSLAVYCLECDQRTTRPVGHGLSWSAGVFTAQGRRTFPPIQSHRSLRAVNCQATLTWSLRDKIHAGELSAKSTPHHKPVASIP